jgi:hypothetical protein
MSKITNIKKSKTETKVDSYSKVAQTCMIACLPYWNRDMTGHTERAISRSFYGRVFDCATIKTGLYTTSHNEKFNKDKHTWDHYLRPQSVAKYIMDNPEENLLDYKRFRYIFDYCRKVVRCTKKENTLLRVQTKQHNKPNKSNKEGIYTSEQYINLGIRLYDKNGILDKNVRLPVFDGYTEWEGKYFNNKCRPTTVYTETLATLLKFLK